MGWVAVVLAIGVVLVIVVSACGRLDKLAKSERSTAEDAALNAVPGEVLEGELEIEGGSVAYGVEVAGDEGSEADD